MRKPRLRDGGSVLGEGESKLSVLSVPSVSHVIQWGPLIRDLACSSFSYHSQLQLENDEWKIPDTNSSSAVNWVPFRAAG